MAIKDYISGKVMIPVIAAGLALGGGCASTPYDARSRPNPVYTDVKVTDDYLSVGQRGRGTRNFFSIGKGGVRVNSRNHSGRFSLNLSGLGGSSSRGRSSSSGSSGYGSSN
jgi:hypothetical protein